MMLAFLLQRAHHYVERENVRLHSADLEKMVLSAKEYTNSKTKEGEISVGGKMYDVEAASFHGSEVELLVSHDVEEDNLIASIKNFFNTDNSSGKDFPNQLLKLIVSSYMLPFNTIDFSQSHTSGVYSLIENSFYHYLPSGSFTPPPEVIA